MKNEVLQVSFKFDAGDSMSVFSHEFDDIIFCKYLHILEIISDFSSDSNTIIDFELAANSYIIACTNIHNFVEKGEDCASTILAGHFEPLFHTLGSDMTLFVSIFKFKEPLVILVVVLISFGVKNQVPKVSFKIVVRDLMSVFSHKFVDIISCE